MPAVDRTGQTYGRLVVIERAPSKHKRARWACSCVCGNFVEVDSDHLRRGGVKSCGCLKEDHGSARRGHKSGEYFVWAGMRQRCSNPINPSFKNYGERGISVCERWDSFSNFIDDMGPRPSNKYMVERADNDGNYEPGNCHWATNEEQSNNRRSNIRVVVNGESMTRMQASKILGFKYGTVISRIHRGMSAEEAMAYHG